MRAGPLSDDKVIALLNSSFVPVFVSNEDYESDGRAPPDEKKEKNRIYADAVNRKLGSGTVHCYVLNTKAELVETLGVVKATQENGRLLVELLERQAKAQHVTPGDPPVKPRTVSTAPPNAPADALVLHVVSRGENTGPQGGSWREFPAENWLVLKPDQWRAFLPPAGPAAARPGEAWDVDKAVAESVLHYFYPQAEDPSDAPLTTIERQTVRATVVSADAKGGKARIEGSLLMKRPFYPHRPPDPVEATFVGYLTWDTASGRVASLEVVTDRATYQKHPFGVAMRAEVGRP